ncbi:MAG TPA: NADPH:quinone reductase [bacterium]|nr:NADPH:quinone reductase [bacterium]
MKAIVVRQFGGPEVMKLEPQPDPVPGPGQVLVAVKAAGVNPVETYVRSGNYGNLPALPYSPGADAAGLVEAVGPDVQSPKPGDRVYVVRAAGAYAEKVLAPSLFAFPLPAKTSFAQGAAMGVPYSTAHRALFHKGGAKKGETVLIHGASGGVGTAAIQLAKRAGLKVLGTGGTQAGRDLVKAQGADEALDHHDPAFAEKLKEITGGQGVDLILEMAAHLNLGKDLGLLAKFGRVVVVGSRGPVEINPRDLMTRDADIRALTIFNAPPEDLVRINEDLVAGLAEGKLNPAIGQEFPLAQAPAAHQAVMAPGARGKVVLIP